MRMGLFASEGIHLRLGRYLGVCLGVIVALNVHIIDVNSAFKLH